MKEEHIKIIKIIGNNIKKAREEQGITLTELSKKIGIRKEYLKKVEEGTARRLSSHNFFLIADGLNIKTNKLVEGL